MTDHIKDQLCARIEELEKEKLELNEQLDIAQQERDALTAKVEAIKAEAKDWKACAQNWEANAKQWVDDWHTVKKERDALAAHVERQRETLQWIWDKVNLGGWSHERVKTALADTPTTSLARLKAKWQSEALGHVLAEVLAAVEADTVRAHLRNAMRKLRRQAEGGEA